MIVETRSIKNNEPPKDKNNLYNWLKENKMLLNENQIKEKGLIKEKVIFHEFVFGWPISQYERIYAVAPEGYNWIEDIELS